MMLSCTPTLAIAILVSIFAPASPIIVLASSAQLDAAPIQEVRLLDLPGVRRLFDTLAREWSSMNDGEQAAAWAEFSLLAAAVAGDPQSGRSRPTTSVAPP